MNKFKKFMAIASCAAIVLSFAACGDNAKEETTTETTTAAETTTSPMENAETRFSHVASMNVWTKGKKVSYKKGETKVMTATAALNDSVKNDIFAESKTNATAELLESIKKNDACIEFSYEKEQTAAFLGDEFNYDQVIVAITGEHVNTIFFLKDGKSVGSTIEVTKCVSKKTVSENVSSAVEIVTHPENHTH